MTEKAKFRYSAVEGTLELEGSESFVSQHFEALSEIIRTMAHPVSFHQAKTESATAAPPPPDEPHSVGSTEKRQESIDDYPHAFSQINGKLKIVLDIKGSTAREKMTSTALVYCYGANLLGEEQVSSKRIREICEQHGCLDSANFSKIFDDQTTFLSDGVRGGNKSIKLTFQGNKKARELLSV